MAKPIVISVLGDTRDLVRSLGDSESRLSRLGGAVGKLGKVAALGFAAAGAGAVAWGVDSVKSLARIETINAQTAAAIKSTGGAAGVTAKHIESLSGRLEDLTATEAETTQENANLLLTFTNVRNEAGKGNAIFDRTVSTLVDMQRAVPTASMTSLGKALNDPIKGISALSRVGVAFTEQQKDQIKTLVAAGDTMSAQKIILGELDKEFGGSGEAFAKTTQGRIELAQHALGTLGETIFAAVLPPLGQLATAATNGLRWLNDAAPAALAAAGGFTGGLMPAITAIGSAFTTRVIPALTSFGGFLATNVVPVLATVGNAIMTTVVPALVSFGSFVVSTVVPAVVAIYTRVATNLMPVITTLADVFATRVAPTVALIVTRFKTWLPTILSVTSTVTSLASAILGKVLPPVIRFAGFLIGNVVPAALGVVGVIIKIVGAVVSFGAALIGGIADAARFVGGVKDKVGAMFDYLRTLPGKALEALGDLGSTLLEAGKSLIQGLIDGITDKLGALKDKLGSVTDLIPDWKGPAKRDAVLLRPAGRLIIGGLINGLGDQLPALRSALGDVTGLVGSTALPALAAPALTGPDRARFSEAALGAAAAAWRGRHEVTVTLEADQVHELERGRRVAVSLRPYLTAGGTL